MPEFEPGEHRPQEIQETSLSWRNALIATLLTTIETWADLYVKRLETNDSPNATKTEFTKFLKNFAVLFHISKKLLPEETLANVVSYMSEVDIGSADSRERGMSLAMEIQHHLEEKGIVPLVLPLLQSAFVMAAMNERNIIAFPEHTV